MVCNHCPQMHWWCAIIVRRCTGGVQSLSADALVVCNHCPQMHWWCAIIVRRCTGGVQSLSADALVVCNHCPQMHWWCAIIVRRCTGDVSDICLSRVSSAMVDGERCSERSVTTRCRSIQKEMFYVTTHSTHFIYGYMASGIW